VLPDLSILIALVLGLSALEWSPGEAPVDPLFGFGGTAGVVLVVLALCRLSADRAVRALEEGEDDAAIATARRILLWPFLGWITALYLFRWGATVAGAVPRAWFLVPHLLLFLPLCAMVVAGWKAVARVEARKDAKAGQAGEAVRRGLRRNVIVLLPFLVLVAVTELFFVLEAWDVPGFRALYLWHRAFPDVEVVLILVLVTAITWFAPAVARRVLRAEPLPPGPTRSEIERLCDSIGVRCRDFLLWKTEGRVMNAMVVGLSRRTRYVFVTDALLARLPLPEVLAVVAHEAGHVRLRHLPTYFVLSLAALLLMRSVEEVVLPGIGAGGDLFLSMMFLAFFWFGMLGWLSRRFERQADIFAADHAGTLTPEAPPVEASGLAVPLPYGAAMMIAALQRIVVHAGPGRHHRHGPPVHRMAYIAAVTTKPEVRAAYVAENRRLRRLLGAFVLLALVTTVARVPAGLGRGRASLRLQEGLEAAEAGEAARKAGEAVAARGHYERARALFLDAASRLSDRPDDLRMRGVATIATFNAADTAIHHLGLDAEARREFEATLGLLERLPGRGGASLAFEARIELGRLALRDAPSSGEAVARARRWLAEARAIPETEYSGRYRSARLRLLESAIALRDADPAVAAQARADLRLQSVPADEGDAWDELARDAADELARAK
jgi:Zn-dependent protease with chaperone function